MEAFVMASAVLTISVVDARMYYVLSLTIIVFVIVMAFAMLLHPCG